MKSLGIDVGSSSVKVSLLDIRTGECVASVTNPAVEMPIISLRSGWGEQDPLLWWENVCRGIRQIAERHTLKDLVSIGITYQMHGLVALDEKREVLRNAIIWCDSRAVEIGARAFEDLGHEYCLGHILNSPGNFTASKAAWIRENEPEVFARIKYVLLPGDYITYMLSDSVSTSVSGLSEQMLWDFKAGCRADRVAEYYGLPLDIYPEAGPSIGVCAHTSARIEELLGIPAGTPVSYRAGDQPNNAFSLNVLNVGEVAATGGTSGVVYGVSDSLKADEQSRVNTFIHVNHSSEKPRYGVLLCINGVGIMNAWVRRNMAPAQSYQDMNLMARQVAVGSDGLLVLPFGNGAERMLCNACPGASLVNMDLNRHSAAHVFRATQEGIAYSFRYGVDIMRKMGMRCDIIRAGAANLFLSEVFRKSLSALTDARIELYNTDGALGAARGAALGAGYYASTEEAFASLKCIGVDRPDEMMRTGLDEGFGIWKEHLGKSINL